MFHRSLFYIRKTISNYGLYYLPSRMFIQNNLQINTRKINISHCPTPLVNPGAKSGSYNFVKVSLGISVFSWLGFDIFDLKLSDEDELITTIKRSVLLIEREEFAKAEQMLHLALRIAQQTSNQKGITYVYDVMANLAFQQEQLDKAEKLFISVMQRLIANGLPQEDIKNIHISVKLAKICHLKGDIQKAGIGFRWCLEHLSKLMNQETTNINHKLLFALCDDWYAHLLIDEGNLRESLDHFESAYSNLSGIVEEGRDEQVVLLLNDMATVCEQLQNYNKAMEYLLEATTRGKNLIKDMPDLGAIHINLGRIYLKKGIYDKARKSCGYGWKLSIQRKNDECKKEAELCLKEVKKMQ